MSGGINAGQAVGYLDLDTSGFKKGFQSALDDLNVFKDKTTSAQDRLSSLGSAAGGVGKSMTTAVTLPLLGIAGASLKVGNDFEAQMSRVSAISGATGEDFEKLNKQALDLGASTAFSASETAEGMENLASAGFNTAEIMSAMPGMLDLAASSGADLATSADIAASSLRGFGLDAGDAGHVADVFAKAAADTNAGVEDMGLAMKYIAPVAHSMGQSIEETAAAIGIMSNAGIKGEQAGTTLRGALTRLVKPTKDMSATMDALGVNFFNAKGEMLPLNGIIDQLKSSTEGLTQEQKANALATLFGQESLSGMLALVDAGPEQLQKLTEGFVNSDGAAAEMAKTMQGNTKGSIDQMMGALESAGIAIQQVLAPAVTDLANGVSSLTQKFLDLSPEQQKLVVGIGAVVAGIGPALLIFSKMSAGILDIQKVIGIVAPAITGLSLPILAIVGAVGLLAVAWATDFGGIQEKTKIVFTLIKEIINTFLGWFKAVWGGDLGGIRDTAIAIFNGIQTAFSGVLTVITAVFEIFAGLFSGNWQQFWNGIKNLFSGILDIIKGIWSAFWNALKLVAMGYITVVQGIAQGILNSIVGVFTGAQEAMTQLGSNIFNWLKDGMSAAWDDLTSWVTEKLNWLKDMLSQIWDTITSIGNADSGNSDGSFAGGLSYVPYDGFVATLHEGEKVLTKTEAKESRQGDESGGDTYQFYGTDPLTPLESARQMKKAKWELVRGF
jgi:TP901 family phage tail tape measure protein